MVELRSAIYPTHLKRLTVVGKLLIIWVVGLHKLRDANIGTILLQLSIRLKPRQQHIAKQAITATIILQIDNKSFNALNLNLRHHITHKLV